MPRPFSSPATVGIALAVAILAVPAAGCGRAKKALLRNRQPPIPSVDTSDPVEALLEAGTAPSGSAAASPGYDAFHKAFVLHESGCSAKDWSDCVNLGIDYDNGRGIDVDQPRAVKLYKTGCDHAIAAGCTNLASCTTTGPG